MKVLGFGVLLALLAVVNAGCRCSPDDAKIALRDWQSVWGAEYSARRVTIAQAVFADLFAHVPKAKALFDRVNGNNMDSAEFKAHCVRVGNGLDMTLNLLGDPATLDSALHHLSQQHSVRDGVTVAGFKAITESFSRVLTQSVSNFNKDAWNSCFSKIVDGISSGLPA